MTGAGRGWLVERRHGPAAELHRADEPDRPVRTARILEVARPAIVIGSTQSDDVVDRAHAAEFGVDVARRRSGGSAVLLRPGEHVWIDLFVPAGDPLWVDDVVEAAWWVGDVWRSALGSLGVSGLAVHRNGLVASRWSPWVCFAGRGPGEVMAGERKVVGLSQRRTREWIRVQTMVHLVWDAAATLSLLRLPGEARRDGRRDLADGVGVVESGAASVIAAVGSLLPD